MVFFLCDGCNESLKKSQVDSHAARCRDCASVSCVDCNVSFYGDDYRTHTSCITEAEKYEKSVYRPKNDNNGKKKKQNPQEAWNDLILRAADAIPEGSSSSHLKSKLMELSSMGNCPRKEKAFRNFAANSLNMRRNPEFVSAMWGHIAAVRDEERRDADATNDDDGRKKDTANGENNKTAGRSNVTNNDAPSPPSKSSSNVNNEGSTNDVDNRTKPNSKSTTLTGKVVAKAMKKILRKAPNKTLKFKELRKAVKSKLAFEGKTKELKRLCMDELKNDEMLTIDGKLAILVN